MSTVIIVRVAREREYCLVISQVKALAWEMGFGTILLT